MMEPSPMAAPASPRPRFARLAPACPARAAYALVLVTLVASCADSASDRSEADAGAGEGGPQMWCGNLNWLFEDWFRANNVTPEAGGENVCFVVTLTPEESTGPPDPSGARPEPVRVSYYMYFGSSPTTSSVDCLFTGVDHDGAEFGYSVTLDENLSRCEWYASTQLSDGQIGHLVNPRVAGTLEQVYIDQVGGERELWWTLRASGRVNILVEDSGNWLFARVLSQVSFSYNHDGRAVPATYSEPRWPHRGDCGADACWSVQYGEPNIVVGADFAACQRVAEVSGSPNVTYDVFDEGLYADNGDAIQRFHALPADTCSFFSRADPQWATTLDYDAGTGYVTYEGLPIDPDTGLNGACQIVWEGTLRTCE